MKIKSFILRDNNDTYQDTLIVFEDYVEKEQVEEIINGIKKIFSQDYTIEDVLRGLDNLGKYTEYVIKSYPVIDY